MRQNKQSTAQNNLLEYKLWTRPKSPDMRHNTVVTATVTVATTYSKVPNSFSTCLEQYLVGLQVIAAAAASDKRYNSRQ
jgi:hypothetical protein